MDSITQAVLGASLQGALLGRWQGRKALLYGAALGTLPDMDVVIHYGDAVAQMTYHRGFSHSLFVLSALALVLTLLIRHFQPNPGYSSRRLFFTLWLVLITHPLLDAFTSYGTQLFWPLMPTPTAWASLFIIDPLYTLPLLITLIVALCSGLKGKTHKALPIGLALSSLYLATSLISQHMAVSRVQEQLAQHSINAENIFATPTPFNTLLWRVIVIDGEDYYEALTSWFDQQPPQLIKLPRGAHLQAALQDNPSHARLAWFSGDMLRYDQLDDRLVVTDLRLGMTGYHPFRFDFAQLRDGIWHAQPFIERLGFDRGGNEQLMLLLNRIGDEHIEVPLKAWADQLAEPAKATTPH